MGVHYYIITNFTITVAAVDVTVDVVFANVKY